MINVAMCVHISQQSHACSAQELYIPRIPHFTIIMKAMHDINVGVDMKSIIILIRILLSLELIAGLITRELEI